jgi:hypothetical protein
MARAAGGLWAAAFAFDEQQSQHEKQAARIWKNADMKDIY